MPEETTGDTGERTPQEPSPDSNAEPRQEAEPAADATDRTQPDGEAQIAPVPYKRFKEVNDQVNDLRNDKNAAEAREFRLQQVLQAVAQQRQPAMPAGPTESDRNRDRLRQQIRDNAQSDEEADRAYNLLDEAARLVSQEGDAEVERRVMERVERVINERLGSFTGAFKSDRELSSMQQKGQIDEENAQVIRNHMRQVIEQSPGWGSAENQEILLNNIYARMVKDGTVKPGTYNNAPRHQPGSGPLQPGGRRPPTQQQLARDHDKELIAIQDRFPRRFGDKTIQQMRDMLPYDARPTPPDVETSQYGDVPARVARDHYVHRRPNP